MAALLQRSILPALASLRAEHCAAPEADGLPLPEPMTTLHHYPFCPQSRFVRLILAEMGLEPTLQEERPWERRTDYLLLNPAGTTPLFQEENGFAVPGAVAIAEYLDETRGLGLGARRLLPGSTVGRVEVRRLLDWFLVKFQAEVTDYLVTEKIYKRFMRSDDGGGPPDMNAIRAARSNIRYHLKYIGYLIGQRNWLAGDQLTYADLAAAAHLSCVDYLGDVPWNEDDTAKHWYARVKSRPSFRALLSDRVAGMAAAEHYADLDF
jgi:glutathione S-transferase